MAAASPSSRPTSARRTGLLKLRRASRYTSSSHSLRLVLSQPSHAQDGQPAGGMPVDRGRLSRRVNMLPAGHLRAKIVADAFDGGGSGGGAPQPMTLTLSWGVR